MLGQGAAAAGSPGAVVRPKRDPPRSDYDGPFAAGRDAFGDKVLPLSLPVRNGSGDVHGLIGMLSGRLFTYADGKRSESEPTDEQRSALEDARGSLIEGVIEESEDESLMDRYLSGEEIDQKVLVDDLETAVAHASFHPVIPVCSGTGVGTAELLEIIISAFPSPAEHVMPDVTTVDGKARSDLTCDPDGPLLLWYGLFPAFWGAVMFTLLRWRGGNWLFAISCAVCSAATWSLSRDDARISICCSLWPCPPRRARSTPRCPFSTPVNYPCTPPAMCTAAAGTVPVIATSTAFAFPHCPGISTATARRNQLFSAR